MAKQTKRASTDRPGRSKMPVGEVVALAGLVDYAEQAIVSRTLIENAAGTITVFAFDAGQGLSEHSAPFDALVQILEGEGEFTIGGNPVSVATGQAVLMPARVLHGVAAVERSKMLVTMLRSQRG